MKVNQCELIEPLTCNEDDAVPEVAKLLRKHQQRRIVVTNKEQVPIGIISTTDMNNKVVAENKEAEKLIAKDIMTSPIHIVCDINDKVSEIFNKMKEKNCYYCPVTKHDKVYGILTYGEVVRATQQLYNG